MAGASDRSINKYCKKKVEYWSYSFNDEELLVKTLTGDPKYIDVLGEKDKLKERFQEEIRESIIVTGGAIASLLLGDEVNDVDLYFNNKVTARRVAQYYMNMMKAAVDNGRIGRIEVLDNDTNGVYCYIKSAGLMGESINTDGYKYFEGAPEGAAAEYLEAQEDNDLDEFVAEYIKKNDKEKVHGVKFITSNAITLNGGIQIILRFCGPANEIHNNFDFVHATNYWTDQTNVVYNLEAMKALLQRRLVYVGSRYPLASLFRIRKFMKRDFYIHAGEITKIAYDISKLNMNDPKVLNDQLIGVDYAYFHEVISVLKKQSDREIDRTYLFEIIEKVYDERD